jgi:DNA polymerase-3 subunit delta'
MTKPPENLGDLIGQEAAVGILRAALRQRRIGHAYLFVGPAQVGKLTAALLFAKALNCEGDAAPDEACGACKSCLRFEHGNHPQIWRIAPMYRRQPITDPRLLELVEDQAFITIAQTRGDDRERLLHPPVLQEVTRKPIFSPYKVFVFEPADRMTEEAADSLLYTLEEAPQGTVFILVTSRPAALRETVVSRCEQVRFHSVAPEKIANLLQHHGVEENRARLIAALADGRPGRAVTIAERPYLMELRRAAIELAQELFRAPLQAALALSSRTQELGARLWEMEFEAIAEQEREEVAEQPGETEEPTSRRKAGGSAVAPVEAQRIRISRTIAMRRAVPQVLDMMVGFGRDVMVAQNGRPDLVINRDHLEQIQQRAGSASHQALRQVIEIMVRTEGYIRGYVNLDPALEAMYVELLSVLGGAEQSAA